MRPRRQGRGMAKKPGRREPRFPQCQRARSEEACGATASPPERTVLDGERLVMATTTTSPPEHRHALGLPAGSVRALLALGVLGYLWALLFVITKGDATLGESLDKELAHKLRSQRDLAFVYFNIIMVLILAHFFAAHGSTIGHKVSRRSPLGLPAGTVRFLLLGGYLAMAYYLYVTKPKFDIADTGPIVLLVTVLMSCFVAGFLM